MGEWADWNEMRETAHEESKRRTLPGAGQALSVEIVGGRLVISIGVNTLCDAVRQGAYFERLVLNPETGHFDEHRLSFTDKAAFAESVLHALKRETESGETEVHRMFDRAAEHAFEFGGEGIAFTPFRTSIPEAP